MSERPSWPPNWPRALDKRFGAPCPGLYRDCPEDFRVEEQLGFSPEGDGEHLWLWIEKRERTTTEVVQALSRCCSVSSRAIGYAGMKDRVAVTRQWISVHLPGREAPDDLAAHLDEAGVTLLEQARHPRKLKRGVHQGNRFQLRLTGEAVGSAAIASRWAWLCEHGVPNYFGPQRFGRDGRNLFRAVSLLSRGWRKRDDPQGMLLSAARSYLFNHQLARRIDDDTWGSLLTGEVALLDGSNSQFPVDALDGSLVERAQRLDLHPSGVLWGKGESLARESARSAEREALSEAAVLCDGLERAGARLARRALRLRLEAPRLERESEDAVWLSFGLPAGGFATSVLRELIDHPTLNFSSASSQEMPQGATDAPTAAVQ